VAEPPEADRPGSARRGRFISFEGGEGAGKSTQVRRLATRLGDAGVAVRLTREPGGSPGAEQIRALLVQGEAGRWDAETEALLLNAARRDHVRTMIAPALATGDWVLCDRFSDSTRAYQGYGRGVPLAGLDGLDRFAVGQLRPDLTLLLDIAVEIGLERALQRAGGETRFETMDIAFHRRLRDGFLAMAAAEPERIAVIDAGGDEDTVAARIAAAVAARLDLRL
jgi:dTMP kinase